MTKKLNVDAITNELTESAFFRRPQREQPEIESLLHYRKNQLFKKNNQIKANPNG